LDYGQEVLGQLVVPGCHAAEVLQFGEEPLNEVALAVELRAKVRLRPPVHLERNIGEGAFLAEGCSDAISIVCLICEHDRSRAYMAEEVVGNLPVMGLPGSQAQSDREALPIDDRVDFGRQPASGTTETMISTPLFAVAACWCARTDVLSIIWMSPS
jgi:hypothetical protein